MNITIAGNGFVGQAHAELFKLHNVTVYDPPKGLTDFGDPDAVLIAVATPQGTLGECFMGHVFEVMDLVSENIPVLIKSTISLEGWKGLKEKYSSHKITFSPEFLRQKTAIEDVLNATYVLLADGDTNFWANTFIDVDRKLTVHLYKNAEELILAKYLRNSFLALKVSFFNQAYDLCKSAGIDFDAVREAVTLDTRIGDSHSHVTTERGFGGHCFPKDTSAIVETAKKFNTNLTLIEEARKYNENITNRT